MKTRRTPIWSALAFALALTTAPVAIVGLTTAPAAAAEPAEGDAGAEQAPVPDTLRSPRATMETLIVSVVEAGETNDRRLLERAATTLDLSGVSVAVRNETAVRLASRLKAVIDRIQRVEFESIPDHTDGPPYVFYEDADEELAIVIARGADGAWRFTEATVDDIDALYRAFESAAVVEGVDSTGAALASESWLRAQMPTVLKKKVFLLEHWQWLALIVLVLVGMVVARFVRWILRGTATRALERRHIGVPSDMVIRTLRPTGLIFMAIFWVIGLPWVDLAPGPFAVFIVIVKFLVAFGFVWFAYRIIDVLAYLLQKRADNTEGRFDDLLVPLFQKSAKLVITCVGIVFIADTVGISVAGLIAALGVGGIAIALASQDTVKNFFGSLTVILDRPFEVGDAVIIGGNTEGVVEEVGFRSTRIRTYENSLITLPNSNLISAKVDNLGRRMQRRLRTVLTVTYDTSPEKLEAFCEGLRQLIRTHEITRKDGYYVHVTGLGASAIEVLFQTWFMTRDFAVFMAAQHDLLVDVITLANRLGVEFAFPTQTLQLHKGADVPETATYEPQSGGQREEVWRIGKQEADAIVAGRGYPIEPVPTDPPA